MCLLSHISTLKWMALCDFVTHIYKLPAIFKQYMNNIKDKLELIIGYAAVIISMSAYKEELSKITIDLSFFQFTLSQYLFVLIIGFVATLHFYSVPYFFSVTKYFNLKIFKYIESITYTFFGFVLLSPFLLLTIVGINSLVRQLQNLPAEYVETSTKIITVLTSIIAGYFSRMAMTIYKKEKVKIESEKIEEEDSKTFEIAQKLISDGYPNQAILELSKIVENHIYSLLRKNELIINRGSFLNMVTLARKHNLINDEETRTINQLRILRNNVAHLQDENVGINEAIKALNFVRAIIQNTLSKKLDSELIKNEDNKFFYGKVYSTLHDAVTEARKNDKGIFAVIYDGEHPTKSKLDYSLGYFTEYETTKQLINSNFVVAIIDRNKDKVESFIDKQGHLENCILVIMDSRETILKVEGVYANPDEGLKRTKQFISMLNH
jgi:hypothetical protein